MTRPGSGIIIRRSKKKKKRLKRSPDAYYGKLWFLTRDNCDLESGLVFFFFFFLEGEQCKVRGLFFVGSRYIYIYAISRSWLEDYFFGILMQWLFVDTLIPFRFEWRSVDRLVKVLILRYIADSTKMPEAFEAFLSRRCPIIVVASGRWSIMTSRWSSSGISTNKMAKILVEHWRYIKYIRNIKETSTMEIESK